MAEHIANVAVGDKVKFEGERQRYTVQATNGRFVILTKPFNAKRTYLYTIVDMKFRQRGPCDFIFGLTCDVNSPEGANEALSMLHVGEMGVSHRRSVPLLPSEIAQLTKEPT